MPDMLVKLYNLPETSELFKKLDQEGYKIKRALSADLFLIRDYIAKEFNESWAGEAFKAICAQPSGCFIATKGGELVGFACYDTTAKGFFGPTGVSKAFQGKGIGKALYLRTLAAMGEAGYAYAIVGSAGPADFYAKTSGAIPIPDCWPGEYRNLVRIEQ